jgi:uracil phosphoribosyltransferase
MTQDVTVVEHSVLEDRLAVLRDFRTPHGAFRRALHEASAILAIEATRDLPTVAREVKTPLETASGRRLEEEITIVPVLRAGLGMVEGFVRLLADARVGHLGMQRDEDTLEPTGYYERLPPGLGGGIVFLLDPMLATGGSAVAALDRLKANGAQRLRLICLVAAPEGIEAVKEAHPDVPIWTAAVDRQLDDRGYIRPGLGDAGDRVFGTTPD